MRLPAVLTVCALAAAACGGSSKAAPKDTVGSSRLEFTRADGSIFVADNFQISCGEDSFQGGKTSVKVTWADGKKGPDMQFETILADVADGATFNWPYEDASLYQD